MVTLNGDAVVGGGVSDKSNSNTCEKDMKRFQTDILLDILALHTQ